MTTMDSDKAASASAAADAYLRRLNAVLQEQQLREQILKTIDEAGQAGVSVSQLHVRVGVPLLDLADQLKQLISEGAVKFRESDEDIFVAG